MATKAQALKPCPFCGGPATRWGVLVEKEFHSPAWGQAAGCKRCCVYFARVRNGLAARLWNKRKEEHRAS